MCPYHNIFILQKFVTLVAYVIFFNNITSLITISVNIRMVTSENTPALTSTQLAKSLSIVLKLYSQGGFVTQTIFMDIDFEKVKDLLTYVAVNKSTAE